jgi:hypothetical protein
VQDLAEGVDEGVAEGLELGEHVGAALALGYPGGGFPGNASRADSLDEMGGSERKDIVRKKRTIRQEKRADHQRAFLDVMRFKEGQTRRRRRYGLL